MTQLYTARKKTAEGQKSTPDQTKTWQPTQYANIVQHVPSGVYYARFRVKGKLIWCSLKTDKISIAKLRLAIQCRLSNSHHLDQGRLFRWVDLCACGTQQKCHSSAERVSTVQ